MRWGKEIQQEREETERRKDDEQCCTALSPGSANGWRPQLRTLNIGTTNSYDAVDQLYPVLGSGPGRQAGRQAAWCVGRAVQGRPGGCLRCVNSPNIAQGDRSRPAGMLTSPWMWCATAEPHSRLGARSRRCRL